MLSRTEDIGPALTELPDIRALLLNCGNAYDGGTIARVARFAHAGGLVIATDWALKEAVQRAFPGTIEHGGGKTGHEFVEVEFGLPADPGTALMQRVVGAAMVADADARQNMRWWLEGSSYTIRRLSGDVEVILYSQALKQRYGHGSILVRFPHGAGTVYQAVSHVNLQHRAQQGRVVMPKLTVEPGGRPMTTTILGQTLDLDAQTIEAYEQAESADPTFDASVAATTAMSAATFLLPLLTIVGAEELATLERPPASTPSVAGAPPRQTMEFGALRPPPRGWDDQVESWRVAMRRMSGGTIGGRDDPPSRVTTMPMGDGAEPAGRITQPYRARR